MKVPAMLNDWQLNVEEAHGLDLNEYLSKTQAEIYNNIILEFWTEIIIISSSPQERLELFEFIAKSYSDGMPLLPVNNIFFSEKGFVPDSAPHYYHPKLSKAIDYDALRSAADLTGLGSLPQLSLLNYYERHPFMLGPDAALKLNLTGATALSMEQMTALLSFCLDIDFNFFKRYVATYSDNIFEIDNNVNKAELYYSEENTIENYIKTYHPLQLVAVPNQLSSVSKAYVLYDQKLFSWLVKNQPIDKSAIAALSEVLNEGFGLRKNSIPVEAERI